jgi:hypothetical protein
LVDCREADQPDLAGVDLFWRDLVEPDERFVLAPRRALDDERGLPERVLRGELPPRADDLLLLRDAAERPLERVLVWAI